MKTFTASSFAVVALALSACSGGGSPAPANPPKVDPPPVDPPPVVDPAPSVSALRGYYKGTIRPDASGSDDAVVGMISDAGIGYFSDPAHQRQWVVRFGTDNASGAVTVYGAKSSTVDVTSNTSVNPPSSYTPQAVRWTAGTVDGDTDTAGTIDAAYTIDAETGTLSLDYDGETFDQSAQLGFLTGDWAIVPAQSGDYGVTLTFREDGSFIGADNIGCNYTGTATIRDAAVNEYTIVATAACPSGTYTANGMAVRVPGDTANIGDGFVTMTQATMTFAVANDAHSYFVSGLSRSTP